MKVQKKKLGLIAFLLILILVPKISFGAILTANDIPQLHWGKKYMDKALLDGWAYVSDEKINPDAPATREHVLYMIISAWDKAFENNKVYGKLIDTNLSLSAYSDGDKVSEDVRVEVEKGVANRILQGYEDLTLKPQGTITRAEMATLLYRIVLIPYNILNGDTSDVSYADNLPAWAETAIKVVTKFGLVKGYETGKFMPSNKITNAEAITMLTRWVYGDDFDIMDPSTATRLNSYSFKDTVVPASQKVTTSKFKVATITRDIETFFIGQKFKDADFVTNENLVYLYDAKSVGHLLVRGILSAVDGNAMVSSDVEVEVSGNSNSISVVTYRFLEK